MAELTPPAEGLREVVRERYAAAARAATDPDAAGCCGAAITEEQAELFGAGLYAGGDRDELPDTALLASLGCGNPTAVAELRAGETVLDLGSGGGLDVLLSARRVGPTGTVYGLDMTDEMLALAKANQAKAGIDNVHWLKGHIEAIPLPAGSVDVVLSNCVINLSTDKPAVLREAARVLKPGGRFAVSDVVADAAMDDATRADLAQYVGCVAGALSRDEYARHLADAGLNEIEITETHRVHEHAASAVIRARKPAGADPKAVVRRLIEEVMNRGRLELIDELYAPDVAVGARRWIAPFRESFPDVEMEIVELIAEGEKVVGRFRCSATHLGPWRGRPPTGRRFDGVDEVSIFRVKEGRITEAWGLEDTRARERQLGLEPACC
jgi:ubiquinone/menaquinone biosynthesis C-methylase UbiE/predicted ester cyclase